MDQSDAPALNSRQQRTLDALRADDTPRPVYSATIVDDLRAHIEAALEPHRPDHVEGRDALWVDKGKLEAIHSCEARWSGDDWSGWALPIIRGTLTHAAIRRLVMSEYRHIDNPVGIVDEALRRLRNDDSKP